MSRTHSHYPGNGTAIHGCDCPDDGAPAPVPWAPWEPLRRVLARVGAWLERREQQRASRLLGEATRAALLDRATIRTPRPAPLGNPAFRQLDPARGSFLDAGLASLLSDHNFGWERRCLTCGLDLRALEAQSGLLSVSVPRCRPRPPPTPKPGPGRPQSR